MVVSVAGDAPVCAGDTVANVGAHGTDGSGPRVKGRFAPSPTGRMHLGNVYAALMSWLSAKSQGGHWVLRIEDLDPQRSRREYAEQLEDDLRWLGLEWDEGGLAAIGDAGPYLQSERGEIYEEYFARLHGTGLTYPCFCTRADIMSAQAPHRSDGRVVYAGTCRPATLAHLSDWSLPIAASGTPIPEAVAGRHAIRIAVPDIDIRFCDMVYGECAFNLCEECGDFIVRRSDGAWAYQLAVVVDDALMGVTEVVRGNDLLPSAAQQIYLYGLLGFRVPRFGHLPLLCNDAGQRLSKRDASLDMGALRREFSPAGLLGRITFMAGLRSDSSPVTLAGLLDGFTLRRLSPTDTITVL